MDFVYNMFRFDYHGEKNKNFLKMMTQMLVVLKNRTNTIGFRLRSTY